MEAKYIFAIVVLGLFAFLFLIFFIMLAHKRKTEEKLQAYICEMYSDKNLVKTDYEFTEDEDAPKTYAVREARVGGDGFAEEEKDDSQQMKMEDIYGKIEFEGIEEITGNYKPQ